MHVAIDLGETHTHLACWEKGKLLPDACIRVRIPGIARSNPSCGIYPWEHEILRDYFSRLYREYLLPSRMIVESATVSVPEIFDLNTRRILLNVLEETLGLLEVNVIPHSIALIAGYQMCSPNLSLTGDAMIIEVQESSLDFAFVNITAAAGITLEKQFSGDLSTAQEYAEQNGFYSIEGWSLNHLLIIGDNFNVPEIDAFINSLPANINTIYIDDPFTAAEGLSGRSIENNSVTIDRVNIIYPYDFYLEKYDQDLAAASLVRIPFDTANLELDCTGSYRLLSLDTAAICNLASKDNQVTCRIYELKKGYENDREPVSEHNLVLEIDNSVDDLPGRLEIWLDMADASLRLDLKPDKIDTASFSSEDFWTRLTTCQKELYDQIRTKNYNERLLTDWKTHLLSSDHASPDLTNRAETTLFHLYALLQLWYGK